MVSGFGHFCAFRQQASGFGVLSASYRDGPASGENRSHLCRLRILGYFGLDPLKRGSALVGNKLISVQRFSA